MKSKIIDTRRRCPSCFRLKEIPQPLPVCQTCIKAVPNMLQSKLASAILAGDGKRILAVSGEVVTSAWSALDDKGRPHRLERGAR